MAADAELVLKIGSPCRVLGNGGKGPGELIDDHRDQSPEGVSKGSALPSTGVMAHVQAPKMDGVAADTKVSDWVGGGA